ncbi:MAG: TonB-dependent receptor [Chitinophagaceae bacterium]|nr:TonB-dependent receptor [Chitinophagaceae bacterium]
MKILLFFLFGMTAQGVMHAQVKLAGRILAAGQPVPGASVVMPGKNRSVMADAAGSFAFNNISAGKVRLRISAVGFQTVDSSFLFNGSTGPLHIDLRFNETTNEEVVISGTMRAVSKMASPILVEVYTPAYFKKNPTPNIFEALQMVNGVQPQLNCNVCNTGDIHINGMEGPYTMVLIDGMPIVSSLATVYGLSGIPNSMVKRIEIVKGPASTLYGSEAVGGLINIITKDALSAEKLRLDLSETQEGELNADISSSYQIKKMKGLLGINYFMYNQRRDINGDNFTDIALQNRISIFNKWSIELLKGTSSSLALRYIYENRWGGELQWNDKFSGSDSIYGECIKTKRVEVLNTTSFQNKLFADLSYNYHNQESYYGRVKYFATQQIFFAQLRWNKKILNHELLAGIPLRYTFYDDNTTGTTAINGANNPEKIFLPGIFIQDEMKLSQNLTMLAGIRYDYNSTHGNIFTPRLSFKCSANSNNTFRLSTGNGYRVVNLFTEDHAALTGAREVVIASALKPEQSWNGNINYSGFIKHNSGFINIDVSAFYTYFTNKIVADYFTDVNKIIYNNLVGYAISKGITLNADLSFRNGIKIMAGTTLMDVYQMDKTADGKKIKTPQLFAPTFSGTFSISYTLAKQKVGIDLTGRVNGPMYLPVVPNDFRDARSPLYSIINLQLTKSFLRGIEIYGGVKNLLNFIPANPLLHPDDPFNKAGGKYFDTNGSSRQDTNPYGYIFDPSYNYAPVQGSKLFAGFRWLIK